MRGLPRAPRHNVGRRVEFLRLLLGRRRIEFDSKNKRVKTKHHEGQLEKVYSRRTSEQWKKQPSQQISRQNEMLAIHISSNEPNDQETKDTRKSKGKNTIVVDNEISIPNNDGEHREQESNLRPS